MAGKRVRFDPDKVISLDDAAKMLHLKKKTLQNRVANGKLSKFGRGKSAFLLRDEVENLQFKPRLKGEGYG